jgi:CHAT domain-containing protein/uncharacterized protein YfbU (UPF0304 family)
MRILMITLLVLLGISGLSVSQSSYQDLKRDAIAAFDEINNLVKQHKLEEANKALAKVIDLLEQVIPLEIEAEGDSSSELGVSYYYLGTAYFIKGKSAKAVENLEEALRIFEENDLVDIDKRIQVLEMTAESYENMKGVENIERMIVLRQKLIDFLETQKSEDQIGIAKAYSSLAHAYTHSNEFSKSLENSEIAITKFDQSSSKDYTTLSKFYTTQGFSYNSLKLKNEALRSYLRAESSAKMVNPSNLCLLGVINQQIAYLYADLRIYSKTILYSIKALKFSQIGKESGCGNSLNPGIASQNLYIAQFLMDIDLNSAKKYLSEASSISKRNFDAIFSWKGEKTTEISKYQSANLSIFFLSLITENEILIREIRKEFGELKELNRKILNNNLKIIAILKELSKTSPDLYIESGLLNFESIVRFQEIQYLLIFNPESVNKKLLELVDYINSLNDPNYSSNSRADDLLGLATVFADLKNYPMAISNITKSIKLYKELNNSEKIASSQLIRADFYVDTQNFKEALRDLDNIILTQDNYNSLDSLAVIGIESEIEYKKSETVTLKEYVASYTAALYGLKSNFDAYKPLYDLVLRNKGRTSLLNGFLNQLLNSSDLVIREKAKKLLSSRRNLERLNLKNLGNADTVYIKQKSQALSDEIYELETELNKFVSTSAKSISIADIQKSLVEGELFIDYISVPRGVVAFAIAKDGLISTEYSPCGCGNPKPLKNKIIDFVSSVKFGKSLNSVSRPSNEIYKLIVQPTLRKQAKIKSIIISPDGELNFLPFDLLFDGRNYLIERFSISYTPSAMEFIRQRSEKPTKNANPSVVLGNPDFTLDYTKQSEAESLEAALIAARDSTAINEAIAGLEYSADNTLLPVMSLLRGKTNLVAPLGYTQVEARNVSQRLGGKTMTLSGKEANENRLRALKAPRVLHIATHGYYLTEPGLLKDPLLRSGIMLSGAAPTLQKRIGAYGVFSGAQMAGLNLSGTELVFLSACDTALGTVREGEGVAGLGQALFTAGAQNVILTLWAIPAGQSTVDFVTRFYATWLKPGAKDGVKAISSALREVKLEFLKKRRPPLEWAGFTLIGK